MVEPDNAPGRVSPNVKELSQLASALLNEIEAQKQADRDRVAAAKLQAQQLLEASAKVAASHSGSNFGYYGALYYKDFQIPPIDEMFSVEWGGIHGIPSGWSKREPEEVKARIELLASHTLEGVKKLVEEPLAKHLHREMLIQLAPLFQLPESNRERQLLDKLDRLDWKGSAHNEYAVAAVNNYPNMTRDSGAASQGRMLTSHNYYEAWNCLRRRSERSQNSSIASGDLFAWELVTSSRLVLPKEAVSGPNIAEQYERLKTATLSLSAFVCSIVIAIGGVYALQKWPWRWLQSHPNSYSILWMSYAVLLLFLVGLFVRRFRGFCWGVALIPLLVGVLQSLGGPTHSP